jgi:hypothetical protein
MAKHLLEATSADYEELQEEVRDVGGCSCAQEAAQRFVDALYGRFSDSLVLLRLFMVLPYAELPQEDRLFVDGQGRATNTSHLIHGGTPIFTLLSTRGAKPEWNDRRASEHFRCIPLASTAFISSLSMLSRQFASVGFDLGLIDAWEAKVASTGRADQFRGMLYIRDAGVERDSQRRMIVPKQEFVAASGVKTTLGFGSGYAGKPTLVTLFAFTNEILDRSAVEPLANVLEAFISATEELVAKDRFFEA